MPFISEERKVMRHADHGDSGFINERTIIISKDGKFFVVVSGNNMTLTPDARRTIFAQYLRPFWLVFVSEIWSIDRSREKAQIIFADTYDYAPVILIRTSARIRGTIIRQQGFLLPPEVS